MKTQRLGKLAGELNLSILEIVNYLGLHGEEIDSNPNTKLNHDLLELVMTYKNLPQSIKNKLNESVKLSETKEKFSISTEQNLKLISEELGKPTTIFKYFKDDDLSKSSVLNNYLYYSSFDQFNDPFDCYNHLIDFKGLNYNNEQIENEIRPIIKDTLNKHGICCFTRNNKSVLMWSHYANKHQGLCIEFDYSSLDNEMLDMNYITQFKKIELLNKDSMFHLIYSKSKEWSYEQEMRSLKEIENGNRIFPYNPSIVKAVYFGAKANPIFVNEIIRSIRSKNEAVLFYQAFTDHNSFELIFLPLTV